MNCECDGINDRLIKVVIGIQNTDGIVGRKYMNEVTVPVITLQSPPKNKKIHHKGEGAISHPLAVLVVVVDFVLRVTPIVDRDTLYS